MPALLIIPELPTVVTPPPAALVLKVEPEPIVNDPSIVDVARAPRVIFVLTERKSKDPSSIVTPPRGAGPTLFPTVRVIEAAAVKVASALF